MNAVTPARPRLPAGFRFGAPGTTQLVVLFHGFRGSPRELESVEDAARVAVPGADFYVPRLPFGAGTFRDPLEIVLDQAAALDVIHAAKPSRYTDIILVGYSMTTLLVRKLYVLGMGEQPDAPFEGGMRGGTPPGQLVSPRAWAAAVKRIVLLAGVNKGWQVGEHLGLWRWLALVPNVWAGRLLAWFGLVNVALHLRRGSAFVSQLRLQWLALYVRGAASALTVQLLGSIDDVVDPDDAVDLATGGDFIYLDVPRTGHTTATDMGRRRPVQRRRRLLFQRALAAPPAALRADWLPPADVTVKPNWEVENVVFVMHGIRDKGHWTHKVARRVMSRWQPATRRINGVPTTCASLTATYGYFPMLPFILAGTRQRNVDWFLDRYVEAKATYPSATFHFVGHSNGTYLLARALQHVPACRFDRVVFAGSVARTDLGWGGFQARGQVGRVLNYVATCDWVVAIFPNAMQMVGVQDLGGAGHFGFTTLPPVDNVQYIRGDHGAAVLEANWDEMAEFVASGVVPRHRHGLRFPRGQHWLVRLFGRTAPLWWLLLALLVIGSAALIGWFGLTAGSVGVAFACGVGLVLLLLGVYSVLTRV